MNISTNQTFTPGLDSRPIGIQSLSTYFRKGSWHQHASFGRPHHLLLWITRGQCRMTIEGIPKGVGVFNAVYLPAGTPFSMELINTFGQAIRFEPDCGIEFPQESRLLKIANPSAQQEFAALQDALNTELTDIRPAAEQAVSAYGRLIAVWLERQIIADIFAPKRSLPEKLVAKYSQLIEDQHASGKLTGDYAENLEVTLTHLSRTCKDVTGKTAGTLLNQRILLAAQERLLKSRTTVSQISDDLGYSTPGNFARMFQQHTGHSPSSFRRLFKYR